MDHSLDMELLRRYPLLLNASSDSECQGYITVNDKQYRIHLTTNARRNKFLLKITEDLEKFAAQIRNLSRSAVTNDLIGYLDKLVEILSADTKAERVKNHTHVYRAVLNEYREFRQFFINVREAKLSGDLREIYVEQLDGGNRKHAVTIGVNYDDTDKLFTVVKCDLPELAEDTDLYRAEDSLVALYKKFLAKVECPKLQMIFDVMDEIDSSCWVLEPEKPTRKDLYRRIMLENNMSIIVTFSSSDVRDPPHVKFLGPHEAAKAYVDTLNRNITNWDPNGDVLRELLKLLEISHFPCKPKDLNADGVLVIDGECCICFCLRLEGKAPEIICSNQACACFFHAGCLYQYLLSLNYRKYYYEIIGQCPNCDKAIRCPLPAQK